MEQFIDVIMETLERNLFDFNVNTHEAFFQVVGEVVNSKSAAPLIGKHEKLPIFSQIV